MEVRDTARSRPNPVLMLGLLALAIHLAIPVLPLYGEGHPFAWSFASGDQLFRFLSTYLIGAWIGAVAILFGIVMLRRHRSGFAAGVFAAIAIVVLGEVLGRVVPEASLIVSEWRAVLVLGLKTLEAAILVIAASMAMRRWS